LGLAGLVFWGFGFWVFGAFSGFKLLVQAVGLEFWASDGTQGCPRGMGRRGSRCGVLGLPGASRVQGLVDRGPTGSLGLRVW
jgi:hypothetical protein